MSSLLMRRYVGRSAAELQESRSWNCSGAKGKA